MRGQAHQAAHYLTVASALRRHMGAPVWPADQAAVDTVLATSCAALGDDAFDALWAQTHALPLEELLSTLPSESSSTPFGR